MWHDVFMCVTWRICDMAYLYVWHDSCTCHLFCKQRPWNDTCDMIHSFICVTWLLHICDMTHSICDMTHLHMWHDSCILHTPRSLVHTHTHTHKHTHGVCLDITCDSYTHKSYVWIDSFIYVVWLIHICDMIHSYMWHDSFTNVTWLIHKCDMTHAYLYAPWYHMWLSHTYIICVTWLIRICDRTHSYMWHDSFTLHTPHN